MSVFITGLRITNFGRYKGEYELTLENKVYSIVAEREGEPGRSNWCGKSSVLYAMRWCLTGTKPKFARLEGDIITRGEKTGGVDLELSDGTFISRMRDGTTDLLVTTAAGVNLKKAEAQAHIDELLGVGAGAGADDVWFLEQKALDRFMAMDPSDRAAIAMRWFGLEPLGECATIAGTAHSAELVKLGRARSARATLEMQQSTEALADLQARLSTLQEAELAAEKAAEAELARFSQLNAFKGIATARERRAKLADQMREKLPDSFGPTEQDLVKAYDAAVVAHGEAVASTRRARELETGTFDGNCPVTCEECPVADAIRGDRTKAGPMRAAALRELSEAVAAKNQAQLELADRREHLEQAKQLATMNADIDASQAAVTAAWGEAEELVLVGASEAREQQRQRLEECKRASDAAKRAVWSCIASTQDYKANVEALAKAREEETAQERKTLIAQWAARIFGKSGAQKSIISAEFGAIEEAANAILEGAGIDLRVTIQWGREIAGMASLCETCGHDYGKGQTPKICPTCATPRARKVDDRLFVEATDTSGGADNLAGCAVQMAAGAYLRQKGGCGLGTICIDEPFGALDEHNRAALSGTIATMLGRMALEQGFIISHTTDTADATPGRITVMASGEHSKVAVTA